MKIFNQHLFWAFAMILFSCQGTCFAMTVEGLKLAIAQTKEITIIDARSRTDYAQGHILNAINIPGQILINKAFPPVGNIVVYGDGIRKEAVKNAVAALNTKEGIHAEHLEGGYPAWINQSAVQSRRLGLQTSHFSSISFQELKKADNDAEPGIVIVDLRYATHDKPMNSGSSNDPKNTISDLSQVFPSLKVITPKIHVKAKAGSSGQSKISGLSGIPRTKTAEIYVLIDMGDGTSQKAASRLKAMGIEQTAILYGGEKIIQKKGLSQKRTESSEL